MYDSDKMFPVYGFGAKIWPHDQVCHRFPCNFSEETPQCFRIDGVLEVYKNCLEHIELWGPTCFAPMIHGVIENAMRDSERLNSAKIDAEIFNSERNLGRQNSASCIFNLVRNTAPPMNSQEHATRNSLSIKEKSLMTTSHSMYNFSSNYHVLLLITDGIISDLEETKKAIVIAANYPISIIIIGVGSSDFYAMEELDGDDVRVSYNGVFATRDIVQFVSLRDFVMSTRGEVNCRAKLAEEVLREIPDQVSEFMRMAGLKPNDPVSVYV